MSQDSYPTRLDRFKRWAKAMEQGATVGKPTWDKSRTTGSKMTKPSGKSRRKRRRSRRTRQRNQD